MSLIARRRLVVLRHARLFSQQSTVNQKDASVYVDSIFPLQIGRFDIRSWIRYFNEKSLLGSIKDRFSSIDTHDLQIYSVEPHPKDGGVFVHFRYTPTSDAESDAEAIEKAFRNKVYKHGGLRNWTGRTINPGIWIVRGSSWPEDMNRFASPMLRVSFEGPDVQEESLYRLFRPFGRIQNIEDPANVPNGTLRSSLVTFDRLSSAAVARNVVHGLEFPGASSATRLRLRYQSPIQGHMVKDWISKHPRIFLPILFFLVGTVTYTIFDPIRVFMVEGKMLDWFSLNEWRVYKWLRANTYDRIYITPESPSSTDYNVWKERKDAESSLTAYLTDLPSTVTFLHGPQGSGKTLMVEAVLKETGRKALIIDCRELQKATSDTQIVKALANQTGYWPVFGFLSSMNNLIDLASVGLIGQKAGFSSSIEDQLTNILDITATALKNIHLNSEKRSKKKQAKESKAKEKNEERKEDKRKQEDEEKHAEQVSQGKDKKDSWYEGIVTVPETVTSTVGNVWDKVSNLTGLESKEVLEKREKEKEKEKGESSGKRGKPDIQSLDELPIVVIRNFASQGGAGGVKVSQDQLMDVLARWAAKLAESKIAHVIVISDNRENHKKLAQALPSKPLNSIPVYDADSTSALAYVQQKLKDEHIDVKFTNEEITHVERLGGRSSDLESLIHKVRNGLPVKDAVEEIINRGVAELRKNAFGDDSEEAKNLPWSRAQAWAVLKLLSKKGEVPYHEVLLDFPFKGDETPLRYMEQSELVSIATQNGRPNLIRPGRPVYRWVFEQLVNDKVFYAIQEIAYNQAQISNAESTVKACEEELRSLKKIGWGSSHWLGSDPPSKRADYLLDKLMDSQRKLEGLEKKNVELKKTLAKVG